MTSPPEDIVVRCGCGCLFIDWWRPSVNVALDPSLAADEDYMEAASRARCPHCGHTHDLGVLLADARTGEFTLLASGGRPGTRIWSQVDVEYEDARWLSDMWKSQETRQRAVELADDLWPRRPTALLVGCVKTKREGRWPAQDLYDSPLWHGRRRYAEERKEQDGVPWLILSAKHGLVEPGKRLQNYEAALEERPAAERRRRARDPSGTSLRGPGTTVTRLPDTSDTCCRSQFRASSPSQP